jgi:hypothetical protein
VSHLILRPQMDVNVPTPDDRLIWRVGGMIHVRGKPKCLKSVTLSTIRGTTLE